MRKLGFSRVIYEKRLESGDIGTLFLDQPQDSGRKNRGHKKKKKNKNKPWKQNQNKNPEILLNHKHSKNKKKAFKFLE